MYMTVVLCPDGGPSFEIAREDHSNNSLLAQNRTSLHSFSRAAISASGGSVIHRLVVLKDCEGTFLLALNSKAFASSSWPFSGTQTSPFSLWD